MFIVNLVFSIKGSFENLAVFMSFLTSCMSPLNFKIVCSCCLFQWSCLVCVLALGWERSSFRCHHSCGSAGCLNVAECLACESRLSYRPERCWSSPSLVLHQELRRKMSCWLYGWLRVNRHQVKGQDRCSFGPVSQTTQLLRLSCFLSCLRARTLI